MKELSQHIAISDDEAPAVQKVEIHYPLNLCESGVTLIDSPGLNEDWRRTRIAMEEMVRADAVVGGDWAEQSSALRQDMEAIVSSYAAVPISRRCVRDSNRGRVPSGVCVRKS